jgi:dolichol kinase
MAGVFTIVVAELLGKTTLSIIIVSITILYVISEYLRLHKKNTPIITRITKLLAREDESSGWILRPISYAVGILVTVYLFPEPIGYASILILTLGDGFSSLIGARFGRHPIPYNRDKTIEGSIAFFLASFFSTTMLVPLPTALIGIMVGAFIESLPTRYSENIMVPVVSGLFMSITLPFV